MSFLKTTLPVDDFLEKAYSILEKKQRLVMSAAPGSGKTTRLPPFLVQKGLGPVWVLEPRRVAALSAASRVAQEERSWILGREVGYQVRFENKTQQQTALIYMTEAIFLKKIIENPDLKGVGCIVFDEFHERSLSSDVALGLVKELQDMGSPLRVVIMSATLHQEELSRYLENCETLTIPGILYPLQIVYSAAPQKLTVTESLFLSLVPIVQRALKESSGHILVFLPGVGEIESFKKYLLKAPWWDNVLNLVSLHGSLSLEEQGRVLEKSVGRKIILSTNIAESSLTIDGVHCVIDTGLSKAQKWDPQRPFSKIELGRISKASATQRAGRCARQGPGICFRMWMPIDELSFPAFDVPEIQRSDLSEALLFLSSQGILDFRQFSWFEKPSEKFLEESVRSLRSLGALEKVSQKITSLGRELLSLPLPLRLGKLFLEGVHKGFLEEVSDLVVLLQEKDVATKELVDSQRGIEDSDLLLRWSLMQANRRDSERNGSHFLYKNHRMASEKLKQDWLRHRSAQRDGFEINEVIPSGNSKNQKKKSSLDVKELEDLLLSAFRDRLCKRRTLGSPRALMSQGRGVILNRSSLCEKGEYFLALQGVEQESSANESLVSMAHPLAKSRIIEFCDAELEVQKSVFFDESRGQFYFRQVKKWGELILEEGPLERPPLDLLRPLLPLFWKERWSMLLEENKSLFSFFERISFLNFHLNEISPFLQQEVKEIYFHQEWSSLFVDSFLEIALMSYEDLKSFQEQNFDYILQQLLSKELMALLDKELPMKIQVPSGSWVKVHYSQGAFPFLEVRLQEVFGMRESPKVLWGKIPLTLHLLGPHYKAVQVTQDISSFWKNGYSEVRKELRFRYPKHQWPEDPYEGIPQAKGRPQRD